MLTPEVMVSHARLRKDYRENYVLPGAMQNVVKSPFRSDEPLRWQRWLPPFPEGPFSAENFSWYPQVSMIGPSYQSNLRTSFELSIFVFCSRLLNLIIL